MAKTLEPGAELDGGKYRIVRLLGQGGMGSVFEAEHRDTQKRVAIKCLHPLHADDPEVAERLVREAQATARVRHPNVVDVYDVGRDGATIYLVMQYLEGETLAEALARRDIPRHVLLALLITAMRGVAAAHKHGVVHRDIKPDNIFLAREDESVWPVPKLLDFGISKLEERGLRQRALTRSGVALGTPSYMSYEQLAGELVIDGRADVYAFGVILYEALTGGLPYQADTFAELMVQFTSHVLVAPSALSPELPAALSGVIMGALVRDRDQRTASIEALICQLEPFAVPPAVRSVRAVAADSVSPAEVPARAARRRSAWFRLPVSAAIGGLVLVLLAALLWLARFQPNPPAHALAPGAHRPSAAPAAGSSARGPELAPGAAQLERRVQAPARALSEGAQPPGASRASRAIAPPRPRPKAVVYPAAKPPRDFGIY